MQALATFLFFIVFIELFLALTIYLIASIYTFLKRGREVSSSTHHGEEKDTAPR